MKQAGWSRRALIGLAGAWLASGPSRAQTRPRFVLATGAAGGVFHDYGPALAEIIDRHGAIDFDVQATAGSNENIRALAAGEADFGLVSLGPAYRAWEGLGRFAADGPQRGLRALFPMYEAPLALIAQRDKGIRKLSDLKGRKVGVGPAGGPADLFFKGLIVALGIEARTVTGAPGDLVRKVLAGEIDALWSAGALPVAAFKEILTEGEAIVLGLGTEDIAALRTTFPFFTPAVIPAATYRGQRTDLTTAAVWSFVLCAERLPDEAAYTVTRIALEQGKELAAAVPSAIGTKAANISANTFLPFHPGALRYYREAGIAIPPALVPQ